MRRRVFAGKGTGVKNSEVAVRFVESLLSGSRGVAMRCGVYRRNVRRSICRAMYSFSGECNKCVVVNMRSSNAPVNVGPGVVGSVGGGFIGRLGGPSGVSPALCLSVRSVMCRKVALL